MLRLLAWATCAILLLFNLRRLAFLLAAAYDLLRPRPPDRSLRSSFRKSVPLAGVEALAGSTSLAGVEALAGSTSLAGVEALAGFTSQTRLKQQPESGSDLCHVLILAPLRNEVHSLPGLFTSLLALDYPQSLLTIGLIDDGSTDGSGRLIDEFASSHAHVCALRNATSLGKANALNAGLRQWAQGDLVMVYDADARPQPDSLRQIVAAFDDPFVAAAGGLIRPRNGLVTPAATYSAIERLVHQQVTQRGKDRLDLAPALLGSHCIYRRRDLEAAGGFPGGALLEDSHLTVVFARQGRKTRFLPDAVATDQVPETLRGYWRQHVRWGRGFHEVADKQARATRQISGFTEETGDQRALVVRLELWMFALGYLDRLALLLGAGLLARDRVTRSKSKSTKALAALIGVNLILPYVQIALALVAERASWAWWLRLPLVPFFFLIDIAAAAWSILLSLARRPRLWQQTERQKSGEWSVERGE